MRRRSASVILLLALGSLSWARGAVRADEPRDRGMLAVVRADGLLIPFAAYDGDRWSTPWPATTRNVELPTDLAAVPAGWLGGSSPDVWDLHLADGTTRLIKAVAPRMYRVFCAVRLGILTDYRSITPAGPVNPFPKDGLAATPAIEVTPIERVDQRSPEIPGLLRAIAPELNSAEDRTIRAIESRGAWSHPFRKEDRRLRPVTIEAWYRAPMDEPGWTASYIEAVRAYPAGKDDEGCGLETVYSGWMHQKANEPGRMRVQLTARVTYCDRVGVNYMLPFGRIHAGGRQHWIYQLSGFDGEWYVVARMEPLKLVIVAEAHGGACPS